MGAGRIVQAGGFTMALLAAAHYSPLAKPWQRPGIPGRIGAYTVGTTAILLGLGSLPIEQRTMRNSFFIAACGGLATATCYIVDHFARLPAYEALHNGPKS